MSFSGLLETTRIHKSFVSGCLVITPANSVVELLSNLSCMIY